MSDRTSRRRVTRIRLADAETGGPALVSERADLLAAEDPLRALQRIGARG